MDSATPEGKALIDAWRKRNAEEARDRSAYLMSTPSDCGRDREIFLASPEAREQTATLLDEGEVVPGKNTGDGDTTEATSTEIRGTEYRFISWDECDAIHLTTDAVTVPYGGTLDILVRPGDVREVGGGGPDSKAPRNRKERRMQSSGRYKKKERCGLLIEMARRAYNAKRGDVDG